MSSDGLDAWEEWVDIATRNKSLGWEDDIAGGRSADVVLLYMQRMGGRRDVAGESRLPSPGPQAGDITTRRCSSSHRMPLRRCIAIRVIGARFMDNTMKIVFA